MTDGNKLDDHLKWNFVLHFVYFVFLLYCMISLLLFCLINVSKRQMTTSFTFPVSICQPFKADIQNKAEMMEQFHRSPVCLFFIITFGYLDENPQINNKLKGRMYTVVPMSFGSILHALF